MTANQFAAFISAQTHTVWAGVSSYDTRPYVQAGTAGRDRHKPLPVAYWGGNANNYVPDEGYVEAGDVLAFVNALPEGAVIVVPYYWGSNWEGEDRYVLAKGEWMHHSSRSVHDEVSDAL